MLWLAWAKHRQEWEQGRTVQGPRGERGCAPAIFAPVCPRGGTSRPEAAHGLAQWVCAQPAWGGLLIAEVAPATLPSEARCVGGDGMSKGKQGDKKTEIGWARNSTGQGEIPGASGGGWKGWRRVRTSPENVHLRAAPSSPLTYLNRPKVRFQEPKRQGPKHQDSILELGLPGSLPVLSGLGEGRGRGLAA